MPDHDSFARRRADDARHVAAKANKAVHALRGDMDALLTRMGVIETKTAGVTRLGRCGLCGEPTRRRYCRLCEAYFDEAAP